jgi:hypothetical protein
MKTDDFEKRLQQHPQRKLPTVWREEILTNAQSAAASPHAPRTTHHGFALSTFIHQLSTLLRPQRVAWCGIAAAWVVIIALNISARDNPAMVATSQVLPPSPQAIAAWREQRRELASLTEPNQPREIEALKPRLPQPRSNRRTETFAA